MRSSAGWWFGSRAGGYGSASALDGPNVAGSRSVQAL